MLVTSCSFITILTTFKSSKERFVYTIVYYFVFKTGTAHNYIYGNFLHAIISSTLLDIADLSLFTSSLFWFIPQTDNSYIIT